MYVTSAKANVSRNFLKSQNSLFNLFSLVFDILENISNIGAETDHLYLVTCRYLLKFHFSEIISQQFSKHSSLMLCHCDKSTAKNFSSIAVSDQIYLKNEISIESHVLLRYFDHIIFLFLISKHGWSERIGYKLPFLRLCLQSL